MTDIEYKKLLSCSDKASKDTIENISSICYTLPKRSPGSEGEAIAAQHMQKQLEACGASKVNNEKFKLHPGAFYGWIFFSMSFAIAAAICTFFLPILATILALAALLFCFLEFGIYKEFIDKLFPEKQSQNIVAYFKPKNQIKQRIVLDGHIDAAWPWPVNEKCGGTVYHIYITIALIGVVFTLALSIFGIVIGHGKPFVLSPSLNKVLFILACVQGFFLPFWIGMYWMWDRKKTVDGANDNLTGCCLPITVAKMLKENNVQLEQTELVVLLAGSEEAGLRGAKAFAQQHKNDFKDVPTRFVCLDCLGNDKRLAVNYRDLNSIVKLDKETCDMFYQSGKNVGVDVIRTIMPPFGGSTNAPAYQQAGFKACSVWALNLNLDGYYHTTKDRPDRLNKQCLENTYKILIDILKTVDNQASI